MKMSAPHTNPAMNTVTMSARSLKSSWVMSFTPATRGNASQYLDCAFRVPLKLNFKSLAKVRGKGAKKSLNVSLYCLL